MARAVARVRSGHGECVLVTGEAGIGKTSLVRAALAGAERVHWGRCHEASGAPPYWPWMQALRSVARTLPADELAARLGDGAADLLRLLPELRARVPAIPEPPPLDAETSRFRLFDAVAGFVRAIARDGPVAIVLDDLHWADSESLLLLRFVAAEIDDAAVLLVGTCRDVELRQTAGHERLLGDLARVSRRVALAGLQAAEVTRVVAAAAGPDVGAALGGPIHDATAGNPFFVEELLEVLRQEQRLDAGAMRRPLRMPDGVRDMMARRLAPLPPEARAALGAAAVLGRQADAELVAALLEVAPAAALDALGAAVAHGLLQPGPRAGTVRFPHALVQQAALDDLPAAAQADLHRRAAGVLARRHAADPDAVAAELAHHYLVAGDVASLRAGVDAASRAAARAVARLGYEEAAGLYERALAAHQAAGGDATGRLELLLGCGDAQRWAGDDEGSRATLLEATRLAGELGDVTRLARAALSLAAARAETGRPDVPLIGILAHARHLLAERDDPLRVQVLGALSRTLYFTRDVERRLLFSAEAVAMARRLGSPASLATALIDRLLAVWGVADVDERLAMSTEAIALAVGSRLVEMECEARGWRILALYEAGHLVEADAETARLAATADHWRLPRSRWHVAIVRAARALLAGDVPLAEALATSAASLRREAPGNNVAQFFALQLFHVRRAQGRLAELDAAMRHAIADLGVLPIWRCGLALLHAELGRPADARAELRALVAPGLPALPRDGNFLPAIAVLAEVAARAGDAAAGEILLPALAAHAGQLIVIATTAVCMGPVSRYAALAAAAAGRLDEAVAHGRAAVAATAALGARLEGVRATRELAAALLRRDGAGDREQAAALAETSAVEAAALGVAVSWPPLPAAPGAPRPLVDAARVAAESGAAPAARPVAASLRREGDVWTLACGRELMRLRDVKGLVYLSALLRQPGREVHALDLVGAGGLRAGDAGEVLDAEARAAYRARLADLRAEIEVAEAHHDLGRVAALGAERDALAAELTRAVGLGGRARRAGSDAERARLNVTRAIAAVLRKIATDCPVIGRHLASSIRTGTVLIYEPDPGWPLRWELPAFDAVAPS